MMNDHRLHGSARRHRALAALFVPVIVAACGGASEAPRYLAQVTKGGGAKAAPARMYSVINLGLDGGAVAMLNERGQAVVGAVTSNGPKHRFFDGDRLHELGTLGGYFTHVQGLSNEGMVVGTSDDDSKPFSEIRAFSWTVETGMRALPGPPQSEAVDVNDKGQIVGQAPAEGMIGRAIRWEPDGSVTSLGPLPFSLSKAYAVNNDGVSTGFADVAGGSIHATVWDRRGTMTNLGTLGGYRAFGLYVNERGDVAGVSDRPGNEIESGFFWSARDGMVAIDAQGGGSRLVAALNDHGEVVGDTTVSERPAAYLWTRRRGLTLLPLGTGIRSDVFDLNNQTDMVGAIERSPAEGGGLRAVRWPGLAHPVDLNNQLYRAPAGLVLYAGAAINDKGVILAHSNAGLVLLRPGKHGTDAPVLGPMMGLPDEVVVGQQVEFTVGFTDNAAGETHTASATWSDQCPSRQPSMREAGGTGQARFQHRFCTPGYFSFKVQVTDSAGRTTELQRDIMVNEISSVAAR